MTGFDHMLIAAYSWRAISFRQYRLHRNSPVHLLYVKGVAVNDEVGSVHWHDGDVQLVVLFLMTAGRLVRAVRDWRGGVGVWRVAI